MELKSGKIDYQIKNGYVHLYVSDSTKNAIEVVATKEQIDLLFKIILRK